MLYTCVYRMDPEKRAIRWDPQPGPENAQNTGAWRIEPAACGTRLSIENELILELPIPRLARKLAQGFVARQNERLFTGYLAALKATHEGGRGA